MVKNYAENGKENSDKSYQKAKVILIGMVSLSIVIGYKIGYRAGGNHELKELNKLLQRFYKANPHLKEEFVKTSKILGLEK